jgi:hypothetical protein
VLHHGRGIVHLPLLQEHGEFAAGLQVPTRAVRHHQVRQLQYLLPAMPTGETQESVQSQYQHQPVVAMLVTQRLQGIEGI